MATRDDPKHYLRCCRCKTEKPSNCFHRNRSNPSGRQSMCKECRSKVGSYRPNHKEHSRAWNKRNPEKTFAYDTLRNALVRKIITRPEECQLCKGKKTLHGHHEDYSKPLDVLWVCALCHKKVHAEKLGANHAD